jgi:arabinofuranosyltransferase
MLLALAASVALPLLLTEAPQDDAYISYIYARNFSRGAGLVYNAGEPPVEGYTNFLWTVLIGLGMRAGLDAELFAPWLGLLALFVTVILTARLTRLLGGTPWFAAAAALLFATRPALTIHAMGGLETTLFSMFVLLAVLPRVGVARTRKDDIVSSLALAAAALTRPEGILIYGLLEISDATLVARRGLSREDFLAGFLRRAVPFVAIVGIHTLWRLSFYGDLVPNTFHAKATQGPDVWASGLGYSLRAIFFFSPFLFLIPYFPFRDRVSWTARLPTLLISTVFIVYVASVGRDYLPRYRYLLPVMPLWCAMAGATLVGLGRRLGRERGITVAGILFVVVGAFHTMAEYRYDRKWPRQDVRHRQLVASGRKLDELLPKRAWIAVTAAGRVPYFADRRAIDMIGLSDRHIARRSASARPEVFVPGHVHGDGKYVLDLEPDAILFLNFMITKEPLVDNPQWPKVAERDAFGVSEREIVADSRLRTDYRLYSVALQGLRAHLNFFGRRDLFDEGRPVDVRSADWSPAEAGP